MEMKRIKNQSRKNLEGKERLLKLPGPETRAICQDLGNKSNENLRSPELSRIFNMMEEGKSLLNRKKMLMLGEVWCKQ